MTHNNGARVILAVANEADDDFIWDQMKSLQADMFAAGPVSIKVAYFGREGAGMTARPFISTRWATDSDDLCDLLDRARAGCVCGCYVDIADILAAALKESEQAPVEAVVIIGDCWRGDQNAAIAKVEACNVRVDSKEAISSPTGVPPKWRQPNGRTAKGRRRRW
jgi:hypothetical protein